MSSSVLELCVACSEGEEGGEEEEQLTSWLHEKVVQVREGGMGREGGRTIHVCKCRKFG